MHRQPDHGDASSPVHRGSIHRLPEVKPAERTRPKIDGAENARGLRGGAENPASTHADTREMRLARIRLCRQANQ